MTRLRGWLTVTASSARHAHNLRSLGQMEDTNSPFLRRIVLSAAALLFVVFAAGAGPNQTTTPAALFDVVHYNLLLEPDIDRKSITGKETIRFISRTAALRE